MVREIKGLSMKYLYIIFIVLITFNAYSQDSEVTVLAVVNGSGDIASAEDSLRDIAFAYRVSQTNSGRELILANAGQAIRVNSLPNFAINAFRSSVQFNEDTVLNSELQVLRDRFNADLIMVFTGGGAFAGNICGVAGVSQPGHWIDAFDSANRIVDGRFQAGRPPEGVAREPIASLDLFGAEQNHFAMVVQDGLCEGQSSFSATHEFGHLFGGGHIINPPQATAGSDAWLFADSHAGLTQRTIPTFPVATSFCVFTSLATDDDTNLCTLSGNVDIRRDNSYSSQFIGANDQNNARTIGVTTASVANYRQELVVEEEQSNNFTQCSDGLDNDLDGLTDLDDADCSRDTDGFESGTNGQQPAPRNVFANNCLLARPTNVRATLIPPQCNEAPFSRYLLEWNSGSSCPVGFYEVYSSTPNGEPFRFVGATLGTSQEVVTRGDRNLPNAVRVRACDSANPQAPTCTALSVMTVTLDNLCQ
jgi:hypothetical protein